MVGGVLFVGASSAGATETSEPPPTSDSSTTTSTTSTTSTTTSSTSTTIPPAPLVADIPPAPLVADIPLSPASATPERGTQAQVTDTLPPPPTTTTTTTQPTWQLPLNSGSGRRVVYSKSRQRLWTVEADGTVSKTHLVSGRLTWNQPLPGTYSVFSRSGYTCAIKNMSICWRYMVRFAKGGSGGNIGFHEIPTDTRTGRKLQSVWQLGTPLSGGCVRQSTPDAQYIWGWAPVGTKVVVLR